MSTSPIHVPEQDSHSSASPTETVLVAADSEIVTQEIVHRDKPSFDDSAYGSYAATPVHPTADFEEHDNDLSSLHDPVQITHGPEDAAVRPEKPVSWMSLPRKDQLCILTLARLAEPIVQTSLGAYMYFMLKSFDPEMSDSAVSTQAGLLSSSFTFAQCLTAVIWGRLADKEWMGRKNVLIIGLLGTLVSCLGFGFSKSFASAMFFRAVGGALNGNVGVMRTMVSEIIVEKKFQPKAFLIMPITFNVGVLIGPLLGGWLQDPVNTFPATFGPHSVFGGNDGVQWMRTFPYALPNLLSAVLLALSVLLVVLGLEETHIDRKGRPDFGVRIRSQVGRLFRQLRGRSSAYEYSKLDSPHADDVELSVSPTRAMDDSDAPQMKRPKLPFRRIFTKNVVITYMTHGMLTAHLGSFANLWFLFLSTPRFDPAHPGDVRHSPNPPFVFGGGLGLPPPTIGLAIGILGAIGLTLQFGVYSRVTHKLGIVGTYRRALPLFPIVYMLVPFLAILPTNSAPPNAADGPWLWMTMCVLLFGQVVGRTFSLPLSQILINNCTPHPSVLSTIHGMGTSVSAGSRTLAPIIWSALYGKGLDLGIVGIAWWALAGQAVLAVVSSFFLYEGTGHEIRLEGDP